MTVEEISKLTLGELEAIAARLDAAAKVFRDARALLGGAGGEAAPSATVQAQVRSGPPPQLNAQEIAQREMLLARNREMPEEIQRAERQVRP